MMLGCRKTNFYIPPLVWYYCYRTVLSGNMWLELELELEPEPA